MNLPHQTIHFSTYELFQNKVLYVEYLRWQYYIKHYLLKFDLKLNKERKYNPAVHVLAGGAAGAVASAVTTPLDVVKTLLNTQETGVGVTRGMKEAILQVTSFFPNNLI